jgi:hypothetical protein
MAHQGGDLVATVQGFFQQGGADIAGGADQGDFHGVILVGLRWVNNRGWIKARKSGLNAFDN